MTIKTRRTLIGAAVISAVCFLSGGEKPDNTEEMYKLSDGKIYKTTNSSVKEDFDGMVSYDSSKKLEDRENKETDEVVPGKRTLGNLLRTALLPLGHTMYVWGGGWNFFDSAAGDDAKKIGVSPVWEKYAANQDSSYNYENTKYMIHSGLDCSGYVGWIIYNVFESEDYANDGYVMSATLMANTFSDYEWGDYTPASFVSEWSAGDIMSMDGHVWIALGTCEDGSVLLIHSSPPGVKISGTTLFDGTRSEAIELAEKIMKKYYPEWYRRYPDCSVPYSYLTKSGRMRWNNNTLEDKYNLQKMDAYEVVDFLFNKGSVHK